MENEYNYSFKFLQPFFFSAVHLAKRKENLCTFLHHLVTDIAQELKEQTSFPAMLQIVAIAKWNLIITQCEGIYSNK